YFFSTAGVMLVVMTLVYLWYTIGSARLAKQVAVEGSQEQGVQSKRVNKAGKVAHAAAAGGDGGSVGMLVESDVVLHEQADGERPIALNRSLIAVGRIGTTVGWFTVFMFFMSLLFRTIVEQHAPWSN